RQARARRLDDVVAARLDEQERQQRCRRLRGETWSLCCVQSAMPAAVGSGEVWCHEPASRFKPRISQKKVMVFVDRARRLSRASFEAGLQGLSADLSRFCAPQGGRSWQRVVDVTS